MKIILGDFSKLQKVTVSFNMSLCPSVRLSIRMEQLDSHWTVMKLNIFPKYAHKIGVSLKSDRNNEYIT